MNKTELGKHGEDLATNWLIENEFEILERNWRFSRYEIDIIAKKKNKIHFVEVKTRRTTNYGNPEESVTPKKFEQIKTAANAYLAEKEWMQNVQFDIMSILLNKQNLPSFFYIEDIYL